MDFTERAKKQQEKAITKYGDDQGPEGNLKYDCFDFAANELAGMIRYCDMMEYRCNHMYNHASGGAIVNSIRYHCQEMGDWILNLRKKLQEKGIDLGETEYD